MDAQKKVLIIDDDHDMAFVLAKLLGRKGYQVVSAHDAAQGIALARREQPALVILDLGLPAGGGLFVLEDLRRTPETARLPVIISPNPHSRSYLEAKRTRMAHELPTRFDAESPVHGEAE